MPHYFHSESRMSLSSFVLVPHPEVGEHGGLVLGDGGVVDAADLGELVGVDELEGRAADELARLEA